MNIINTTLTDGILIDGLKEFLWTSTLCWSSYGRGLELDKGITVFCFNSTGDGPSRGSCDSSEILAQTYYEFSITNT